MYHDGTNAGGIMNSNSKRKLQAIMAKRKMFKVMQYAVITHGGGMNVAEFVDMDAKVIRVNESVVMLYK